MESLKGQRIIRLSKSCLGIEEKLAVEKVLNHEYLGMGSEVQEFEKALSFFFNRPAVCVTNGTAALQLALQGCNISLGDEVLVPSLTYVASFQAISAAGAAPIACDINEGTLNINSVDAERRITDKTKAIMPVHYSGDPAGLDQIYALAQKYKLRVIEDAAHAFGSSFQEKKIGEFGDIACFSFDGIKNITSGEGGCIITSDPLVLSKIRDARLLGVEKDSEKRFSGQRSWEFNVTEQGWRYHMSNIMAAIGIEQLKKLPQFRIARQTLSKEYDRILTGHPSIELFRRNYDCVMPHIYVVRLKNSQDRKKIMDRLQDIGIQSGIHYQPNHKLELFRRSGLQEALPITEQVYPGLLTLPLHPELTLEDIGYISKNLIKILDEYR